MSRPISEPVQVEYRLNQVFDFIDTNLGGDLSLDRLAEQARFSRYHFLRLFHAWNGEAPHAYVRRRRLEAGASQLLYSSNTITTIANECGFDTADGFSRAFRQYFGVAPLVWRRRRLCPVAPEFEPQSEDLEPGWPVRIAHIPATRVAYIRHVGPYGASTNGLWARTAQWMQESGLQDLVRFGMGLDDPSFTPPEKCRYDICVALPPSFVPPPPILTKTIAEGKYAILRFDGHADQSNRAWHYLLGHVVSSGKYKVAPMPAFERYDVDMPNPDERRQNCELCLPLELQTDL
ncbi:MAG TPA: AraC family transcriptional regulator [Burkholderiaceae bacterium]|jgi:AraC family transcriptional regulator